MAQGAPIRPKPPTLPRAVPESRELEYRSTAGTKRAGGNMSPSDTAGSEESRQETSDESKVIVAALLNLVRLLAAEMVAGEGAHHDVDRLLAAIDRKLNDTPLPGDTRLEVARAGIRRTRALLAPVAAQIRHQAAKAAETERNLHRPANRMPA